MTLTEQYADALMNTFGPPRLALVRGEGAHVWDESGREYVDLFGGIAVNALGHAHPALVEAVTTQLRTLGHVSNFFTTGPQVELAQRLLGLLGADGRVFVANSGTEANEAAFKLTRRTGRTHLVAAEGAFHGRTMGALALTHKPAAREPFEPLPGDVTWVPYGDTEALAAAVTDETAAVVLEPIQGEAGVVVAPDGYLADARRITRDHGALLWLDEVQTGIGRTGSWFAHDPALGADVVTLAKGLGGGIPIGACVGLGGAGGAARARQPRHHLRRQPGRLRRRAGRARHHRGRRAARRRGGPRRRAGRRARLGAAGDGRRGAGTAARCPAGRRDGRGRRHPRPGARLPAQQHRPGAAAVRAPADRDRVRPRRVRRCLAGDRGDRPARGNAMTVRHFLRDDDLAPAEQASVLALAADMKRSPYDHRPLAGPLTVATIYDKPTLRTQASFSSGIAELGGHSMLVDGRLAGIGDRESVADVARVLGRQASAIVWRTFAQTSIEEMAAHAGVPVVNALTDEFHPCQLLADLLTLREHRGALAGQAVAFVGDGASNMGNSWVLAGATAGMHVRIGAPDGYLPDAAVVGACPPGRRPARAARSPSPTTPTRPSPAPTPSSPTPGCRWARRGSRRPGPPPSRRTP